MTGDMMPPPYHEGVLAAAMEALGYRATVRGHAKSLTETEYELSWVKR